MVRSSLLTRLNQNWVAKVQVMTMIGTICLVVGTVTGVETDLQGVLTASSVAVQDILLVNVLQMMVVEVVGSRHIQALVELVVMEIALGQTGLMTVMMGGAMETGTVWIAETTGTGTVIDIAMKDTHLVVIALQVRGM